MTATATSERKPSHHRKVQMHLAMDPVLRDTIDEVAQAMDISASALVRMAVVEWIERRRNKT